MVMGCEEAMRRTSPPRPSAPWNECGGCLLLLLLLLLPAPSPKPSPACLPARPREGERERRPLHVLHVRPCHRRVVCVGGGLVLVVRHHRERRAG